MKILVFSDSHGSDEAMKRALDTHGFNSELALHAGDGAHSFMIMSSSHPGIAFRAVRGNCDSPRSLLGTSVLDETEFIEVCGYKLLLTHGHRLAVKMSTSTLISYARTMGADIVVFGHTHEQYERYVPAEVEGEKPLYLFNPGAAKNGFYGIIDIKENGILLQPAVIH